MKRLILFSFLLFSTVLLYAQNVAINNDGSQPHASAALDIKATDKGLLLPRVANPAGAVSNAAEGLLLYNTTTQQPNFFNGTNWQGMGGALSARFPRAIAFRGDVNSANSQTNATWTVPANITQVWVEMWAAGDAGQILSSAVASDMSDPAGGDAGDYASLLLDVTPGQELSLNVGNGGNQNRFQGGNTRVVNNAVTYEVTQNYTSIIVNNSTFTQVPGLLLHVSGEAGEKTAHTFMQSASTLYRRVLQTGRGGSSYPNQKGGAGVNLHFYGTGELIPSIANKPGGNGASPGAGGGGGLILRSLGGSGLVIVHW